MTRSPSRNGCEKRDQNPCNGVPERALGGEADHEPDHRRRREDSTGDRAHLRNDEQRRQDADEHDRAHDDAAHDP
jgi:hypothetical protein